MNDIIEERIVRGVKLKENPWKSVKRSDPVISSKDIKQLRKVLKTDKLSIVSKKTSALGAFYLDDAIVKIYYNGSLIIDYPKGCQGEEYRYNSNKGTHKIGSGKSLNLASYIRVYMSTPLNDILRLPSGPLGIYEILMAMDERISIKRLESIMILMQSFEARKVEARFEGVKPLVR